MKPVPLIKFAVLVGVVAAVAIILLVKRGNSESAVEIQPASSSNSVIDHRSKVPESDSLSVELTDASHPSGSMTMNQPATPVNLPRLLDLGADKCIPCKMMAPILEQLQIDFKDQMEVRFIDV